MLNVTPVILAGGMGRGLRPLTHSGRPKPFLKIFSKNSLLQETLERVKDFAPPVIVAASGFAGQAFEHVYETGIKPQMIIAEPAQRDTTFAIACAAMALGESDTKMLVMPSDNAVEDYKVFFDTVSHALSLPHDFVLIGVKPKSLSPRYGHVVCDESGEIKHFVERPAKARIVSLAREGRVYWNTGMFLCTPQAFLKKLQRLQPDLYDAAEVAVRQARRDGVFLFPDAEVAIDVRSVSVDYAMMEHMTHGALVALETGWSDVGTLDAFLGQWWQRFIKFCLNA